MGRSLRLKVVALAAGVAETHKNAAFAGSQIQRRLESIGCLIHQFAKKP